MAVEVSGYDTLRARDILEALRKVWPFRPSEVARASTGFIVIAGSGESSLEAAESEYGFSDRVTATVWAANNGVCPVLVIATCLDGLPYSRHKRGAEDEARIRAWYADVFTGPPPWFM